MKKPSAQDKTSVQELVLKAIEALRDVIITLPPSLKGTVIILLIIVFASTRSPWIDIARHLLGA